MRLSTGIEGLDYLLQGGLLPGRSYLVHGDPGTGKTTLGLHFLSAGKSGLLVTFAQSEEHLRSDADSLGLNIANVRVLDLTPSPEVFSEVQTYDIFSPSEVEREPVSRQIAKAIDTHQPQRIFVDGFGQFRNFAGDPFHQRRLSQSFFRFATAHGATLLIAGEDQECSRDVDGVIELACSHDLRTIRVLKLRGSDFHAGSHPMLLTGAGLQVPLNAA